MSKYVFPFDTNSIEFVFAPYFDNEHSPNLAVEIDDSSTAAATYEIDWCYTKIVWSGGGTVDSAVVARCIAPFDAANHDTLIAAFTLPQNATISFALLGAPQKTISGWSKPIAGTGVRQEISVGINSLLARTMSPRALARLCGIRPRLFMGVALRISTPTSETGVLTMTWLGLRNSKAHQTLTQARPESLPDWSPWLHNKETWGERGPQSNLLFGAEEITQLRARKNLPGWKEHFAFLENKAQACLERVPEKDFGDYLPTHDLRFSRSRQTPTRPYHWDALVLAFVGLVNDDESMIHHALRYLMCMLHTRNWADAAEHRVPSSTWNQRSFTEEMTTTSVAILLDWLGFALTSQAKSLARQALWTRGMANVQRDLFQYDYMHGMNQGAVFCRALILGGLTIEQAWPRATQIADEAYRTMKKVLRNYIKSDGGISEGPGYLCQTLTATLWAIIAYSRARGLDWRAEVSELFGAVESYVRVMASSAPGKCIPSGDCRIEWFSGDGIPILASTFPDSAYAEILMNCLREGWVHEVTGTLKGSGGMLGMVYGPSEVKPARNIVAPSLSLPETGKFSRVLESNSHRLRLWATASVYGATHSHLDHGSVVVEVDEFPVFIDRGMAEYWKADLAHQMRRSFAHNLLTPVLSDGRWPDQNVPQSLCRASVSGPATSWLVHIPSQQVWLEYMSSYDRFIEEGDASYIVRDRGARRSSGPVAFHLHTPHEFVAKEKKIEKVVGGVRLTVSFPWATEVSIKKSLPDFAGREIFHVYAVSEDVVDFNLETEIHIEPAHPSKALKPGACTTSEVTPLKVTT